MASLCKKIKSLFRVMPCATFAFLLTSDGFPTATRNVTVAAQSYDQKPGGKGANEAVAVARLGVSVHLVGRVGKDLFVRLSYFSRILELTARIHQDTLFVGLSSCAPV